MPMFTRAIHAALLVTCHRTAFTRASSPGPRSTNSEVSLDFLVDTQFLYKTSSDNYPRARFEEKSFTDGETFHRDCICTTYFSIQTCLLNRFTSRHTHTL
ncbi:hypothetical protein L210DRAFT_3535079 [Boletus edulis BED1]|uniref:Secreted protein n=1 Tax=Boletus edulis BED1 TaxID=1328754 RepID=A0AAD4BY69_BOLED|nr:hypothetical protein L210DRAFT_3535079 [Boletus edulis BED1]